MPVILHSEKGSPLDLDEGDQNFTVVRNNEVAVGSLQSDVSTLQSDVTAAEGDISTLQSDVNAVEADVAAVELDVAELQANVTAAEGSIATLQTDVVALESNIYYGAIAATSMAPHSGALHQSNGSGHPVMGLPSTGGISGATAFIYLPTGLRGINLTLTAYFDVEDFGGQVRLRWALADAGTFAASTDLTTAFTPNASTLNPRVLTTTKNLAGTGPGGMMHFHLYRDADHADDTYGGILDFYFLKIEATGGL